MRTFQQFVIGLISFAFVWGGITAVQAPDGQAATGTALLGSVRIGESSGKCEVPPTWTGPIRGKDRWVPTYLDKLGKPHAYCDRQTGLVWDAAPEFFEGGDRPLWNEALAYCANRSEPWLGQKGGRLPSMAELASLVDVDSTGCTDGDINTPCLPDGHPFGDHVGNSLYWSATTNAALPSNAWGVAFGNGRVANGLKGSTTAQAWCVRGATDADVY